LGQDETVGEDEDLLAFLSGVQAELLMNSFESEALKEAKLGTD